VSQTAPTAERTVRAVGWAALTQVMGKGTMVVATLVLARLLVPTDFGLFAVGVLVINYLDRVKDVGVGAALVYRREDWTRMAGTGLSLSLLSTAALAGLAFVAAPVAADVFHDPRVADLVKVLAVALLVSGLAIVPESRLRREMQFRRRFVPETAAAAAKGAVSIAMAATGFGVWSLAWGQVVGTVTLCLLYWVMSGWRPVVAWDADDARKLLRYGMPMMGVAVFAVVLENLDYLIIGHRMPAADLGYYVLAFRMPELVVMGFCIVTAQVLFPLFSRLQHDAGALRTAYLQAVRYIWMVTVPIGLLFTLLADELVLVMYGDNWQPAVPVLRVLGVFTVVYALGFHTGDVFKAIGRPGLLNTMAVVELLLLLPAIWFAAGHSITAVALALLAVSVVLMVLKFSVAMRVLNLSVVSLLRALAPTTAACSAMAVVVWFLGGHMSTQSPAVRLVVLLPAGLAVFAGLLLAVAPDVRSRLGRGRRPARTEVEVRG
jgi:lipopolysaccharide exporter